MGWYEERFHPNAKRVQCACLACGRAFWLPPCETKRRTTCGAKCRLALGAAAKELRRRECLHCCVSFVPRTTQIAVGQGLYCSLACSTKSVGQLWTPQARRQAAVALDAAIKSGRFVPRSGPSHQQWAGGYEAARRRRNESGKAHAYNQRYRAANPHKPREWSAKRKSLKTGRLPGGTVKRIGDAQRWRCAVCVTPLRSGYHLDHVMPLARGGEHAPMNLQLLCPPCNVRKSAKDPIDFMQSRGFLL